MSQRRAPLSQTKSAKNSGHYRQICERDSEERASKAIADSVHLTLAGRSLDSRKCGKRTFEHVIHEAFMSETPVGIDPRNHESYVLDPQPT